MSFLPAYLRDVYVCFAAPDNAILPGAKIGWVDELVKCLTLLLNKAGIEDVSLRATLEGNAPLSSHLELLPKSATVLVVLSPAYFASEWCNDERLVACLNTLGASRADSLFVVEKGAIDRAQGAAYDGFRHDEFWVPLHEGSRPLGIPDLSSSGDRDSYYDVAFGLANAIARRLRSMATPVAGKSGSAIRVFLAESTDDVREQRAQVQRYLEQEGIEVEPRGRLPGAPEPLAQTMATILDGCAAFVQLLGTTASEQVHAQLDVALAHGGKPLPILQWRADAVDLARIGDSAHRQLLLRETVRAETLTDFCSAVIRIAKRGDEPASSELPSVFVDTKNEQLADVERIFQKYRQFQWTWHQPTRRNLKALIKAVDGVIIYWGEGDSDLTQERYLIFVAQFKALKKRLDRLLIYDGPPPEKPRFKGENFPVANGRKGDEPAELRRFLREIVREG